MVRILGARLRQGSDRVDLAEEHITVEASSSTRVSWIPWHATWAAEGRRGGGRARDQSPAAAYPRGTGRAQVFFAPARAGGPIGPHLGRCPWFSCHQKPPTDGGYSARSYGSPEFGAEQPREQRTAPDPRSSRRPEEMCAAAPARARRETSVRGRGTGEARSLSRTLRVLLFSL